MSDNARFNLNDIENMPISKFNLFAEALNSYIKDKNEKIEEYG